MLVRLGRFKIPYGSTLAAYSPLSLFASGEQGVWYDASDFSTMFQDAAGTTPVTAVEQPVGLILDKSKGLAVQSTDALAGKGNFSNAAYWGSVNGVATISGGKLSFNGSATIGGVWSNSSTPLVIGKFYEITFTVDSISQGGIRILLGTGTPLYTATTAGVHTFRAACVGDREVRIYNNSTATTAVVDNVLIYEIAGNHASQTTSTSRPVLKQDANGKYYLLFDGTDDFLVTGTINPGSVGKAQVFAGVRKLSDAAAGIIAELSANSESNSGTFALIAAPSADPTGYTFRSRGTISGDVTVTGFASPKTNIITGIGDIVGDSAIARVNGSVAGTTTSDQGTGNFGSHALYIGRRGGATTPFNGRLYGLIVRFSAANMSDADIARTETWMNTKTWAY